MSRIFIVGLLTAVALVFAGPVSASERVITVGDCRYGELSRTTHEDAVTGKTTVVICKTNPAVGGGV